MQQPLVSVILSIYNEARTISHAINSILLLDDKKFELVSNSPSILIFNLIIMYILKFFKFPIFLICGA